MAAHEKWMPLYIADYLADTMHLTTRQHGAYLLLLMHAWRNGGYVTGCFEEQTAIVRMSAKDWDKDRAVVLRFFSEDDDGLYQKRQRGELEIATAVSGQRSKAGKASAAKRERGRQQEGNGNPTPVEHPLDSRATPSPSPTQNNSVPNGTAALRSAKDQIFKEYLPWVSKRAGRDCRGVVASLCSNLGDDDALATLRICREAEPVDPVGWINARLRPRESNDQRKDREIREAIERSKLQ